jgi:hypothetical protein
MSQVRVLYCPPFLPLSTYIPTYRKVFVMKYNTEHVETVGFVHIAGGILTLITSIVAWFLTPKMDTIEAVTGNVIPFVLFLIGWSILSRYGSNFVFAKLKKQDSEALSRLDQKPDDQPKRLSLNFIVTEYVTIVLAIAAVIAITVIFPPVAGFAFGGFLGGLLFAGGLTRINFINKVNDLQNTQKRTFYFSDTYITPLTRAAYYIPERQSRGTSVKEQDSGIKIYRR